jgi:cell division protein FtsB
MVALGGGIAALVLGVIGIIIWWGHFVQLLTGAVPIMLILGGALAAYLGFEEIKDKRSVESLDDTSSTLKQEVESLKEELKGLKEEKGKVESDTKSDSGE